MNAPTAEINWVQRLRKAVLVFGSNTAGRHGAGSARFAKEWYGAESGMGTGRTGNTYAIPTKSAELTTLSLDKIRRYVDGFLEYASGNASQEFWLTRIGCGLAGYSDADIAPMFADAPGNILFPGKWLEYFGRLEKPRVIVAGSRDFNNSEFVFPRLDHMLQRYNDNVAIVCGEARGVDALGKAWARQRTATVESFPADWDYHGRKFAGPIRNQMMAWFSTKLVAFPSQASWSGTKDMIEKAKADGLAFKVYPVAIPEELLARRGRRHDPSRARR